MPTKRPDQLPEGEDFNFEDILMIESEPNSTERKLYKAQLRKLMESALKLDPERIGSNPVLGYQSKFDWMIAQMEKIANSQTVNVEKYQDFESDSKQQEKPFVTPTPSKTPSATPSITPTPSKTPRAPGVPAPTPSITPTPSQSPPSQFKYFDITFLGPNADVIALPLQYLPEEHGFTTWEIINGEENENIYEKFTTFKPVSFTPSTLGEKLFAVTFNNENNIIAVNVMKYKEIVNPFTGAITLVEDDLSPLVNGSSITIRIKLS